jgi:hypothetical protein
MVIEMLFHLLDLLFGWVMPGADTFDPEAFSAEPYTTPSGSPSAQDAHRDGDGRILPNGLTRDEWVDQARDFTIRDRQARGLPVSEELFLDELYLEHLDDMLASRRPVAAGELVERETPGHFLLPWAWCTSCTYRLRATRLRLIIILGWHSAAWYWHLVDVVWLAVFVVFYWWTAASQLLAVTLVRPVSHMFAPLPSISPTS